MQSSAVRRLARVAILLPLVDACGQSSQTGGTGGGIDSMTAADGRGYVLQPDEGELLVPCPVGSETAEQWKGWSFNIKVDPMRSRTNRVAMGTETTPAGQRVPVHRHEYADEILFVHKGEGVGVVGNERVPVRSGSTIFVPQGVWHGLENRGVDPMELVFVVSPPGLEQLFRATSAAPGTPCPAITSADMQDLLRKHGYTARLLAEPTTARRRVPR